jgi:hypothetical protein
MSHKELTEPAKPGYFTYLCARKRDSEKVARYVFRVDAFESTASLMR